MVLLAVAGAVRLCGSVEVPVAVLGLAGFGIGAIVALVAELKVHNWASL